MESQPLRILEPVRPRFGEHRGAAEPGIAARNRSVAIDVHHAPCKVAPFVGIVEEWTLQAVQIRLVQPKPVGAGNKQASVRSHRDPAFAYSLANYFDILHAPRVVTEPRASHPLPPDLHGSPLGQRHSPHVLVEIL